MGHSIDNVLRFGVELTCLNTYLVTTADQIAEDFVSINFSSCAIFMLIGPFAQLGFLANLVKVFPGLKTRPLHLASESYGGKFVVRYLSHVRIKFAPF